LKIKISSYLFIGFCLIINLSVFQLHAQDVTFSPLSKFYVKGSLGYGKGINGQRIVNKDGNDNVTSGLSYYGNGIYGKIAGGYQLNNHIGFEIGFGYLSGFQNNLYPPYQNNFEKATGQMWQAIPSVVFSSSLGIITLYSRTGLILGMPEIDIDTKTHNNNQQNTNPVIEDKYKLYNGLATGIQSTIGFTIPLKNNNLNLFIEAAFNDISFLPQNESLNYYSQNGIDKLSTLAVNGKEFIFKDNASTFPFGTSMDQPATLPQLKFDFSGLIISAGVKLNVGNMNVPFIRDTIKKHLYIRANAGYGFALNGDLAYDINDAGEAKTMMFSGSHGFSIGLGVGYMLNTNIGIDIGLNYIKGDSLKSNPNEYMPGLYMPGLHSSSDFQSSIYGNMYELNPSIIFTTHIKKFKPYARFGLLIGLGTVYSSINANISDSAGGGSSGNYRSTWKYSGGVSFGYNSALGIAYPVNRKLEFYTEASFNTIYFTPIQGIRTEDSYNGIDKLNNDPVSDKSMIFRQNYSKSDNSDSSKPTITSPVNFSFSATVISIGIRKWLR